MNELALFAGAGGGILGGKSLGWRTICAVEYNAFCARRLMQRQNEGHLPPFPIWDDVCTFYGREWRGLVDVVSGGFPCQDISVAGKGAGIDGARSGLWVEMARIIGEVQPRYVFVENSPMLTVRGLSRVLGDLAAMGYDARWGVLGAVHTGAPHKRERIWVVAYSASFDSIARRAEPEGQFWASWVANGSEAMADTNGTNGRGEGRDSFHQGRNSSQNGTTSVPSYSRQRTCPPICDAQSASANGGGTYWSSEPDVGRVANGVAARVDRLRAIGNGQVPAVAAMAWQILSNRVHAATSEAR